MDQMTMQDIQKANEQFVQSEVRRGVNINRIREIVASLPQPYQEIDSRFLEEHQAKIDELKSLLDHRGGLHLIGPSRDMLVLARVPGREHLREWDQARSRMKETDDGTTRDMPLLERAVLYPSIDVVKGWLDHAPGAVTQIAVGLLEIARVMGDPIVKKL